MCMFSRKNAYLFKIEVLSNSIVRPVLDRNVLTMEIFENIWNNAQNLFTNYNLGSFTC